jgi:hypothetical protein
VHGLRKQRSKLRAVTLIGIVPGLGEGKGRGFMFFGFMVSAEMLHFKLLSTKAAGIMHLYFT